MASAEFEAHKPEIERLYMEERKSQKEVSAIMESTHGFSASKWQYETQFKKWGFKKNHGGSKTWVYVRERNKRRKLDNKADGDVFINGIPISPRSVRIGIRRKAYESTVEKHRLASLPPTPDGVVVCSPASAESPMLWFPFDLPWFSFSRQVSLLRIFGGIRSGEDISKSSSTRMRNKVLKVLGAANDSSLDESVGKVVTKLNIIMPEEREGDHEATAKSLCQPIASDFPDLSLALYMISNNLESVDREQQILHGIMELGLLENTSKLKSLVSLRGLAAEVLAQKIFWYSLENCYEATVRIMLEAGMDPNVLLVPRTTLSGARYLETPLERACGISNNRIAVAMASHLLSHGACIELESMKGRVPNLLKATDKQNMELFELLLAHGASPSSEVLAGLILRSSRWGNREIPYLQRLFEAGADIRGANADGRTLLGLTHDTALMRWLIDHGCDVNAPQEFRFRGKNIDSHVESIYFHTSPLGIVTFDGNQGAMSILLESGANSNLDFDLNDSVSPLFLAVYRRNLIAIRTLVEYGANLTSLDQFGKIKEPHRKALSPGMSLNEEPPSHRYYLGNLGHDHLKAFLDIHSNLNDCLVEAVKLGDKPAASLLLSLGASANFLENSSSKSAMALAIEASDTEMIPLLGPSSDISVDSTISSLPDMRTAMYLKSAGSLFGILYFNGARILSSAILEEKLVLVEFLLDFATSQEHIFLVKDTDPSYESYASPLESAIYTENFKMIEFLILHGATVNESELNMIVWKALESPHASKLLKLLEVIPGDRAPIPTAFGMAILSNEHSMIENLLDLQFSPQGRPTVLFDPTMLRIAPGRSLRDRHNNQRIAWWKQADPYFRDFELLKLHSVLEIATQNGNRAVMHALLQLDIWTPQQKGQALLKALQFQAMDMFHDLLASGADLNQKIEGFMHRAKKLKYYQNNTPLDRCQYSNCSLANCSQFRCQLLMCEPCSRDAIPSVNAIAIAMDNDDIELTKFLIRIGCDVNAGLGGGFSVLKLSTFREGLQFTRLFLENGAVEPLVREDSVLQSAIASRNKDLASLLCNPEVLNQIAPCYIGHHGKRTLLEAIKSNDPEILSLLLRAGIGLRHQPHPDQFAMPAAALPSAAWTGNVEIVNMLLQSGVDINVDSERDGSTALQVAVMRRDLSLAKFLIQKGADVNSPPNQICGETALQTAVQSGDLKMIDFLLDNGASVNGKPASIGGATALQFAAMRGSIGIVRKLLEAGALVDASAASFWGRTAIEGAAEWGRIDILYILVNRGSSPTGPNRRQYIRAVKLAEEKGHFHIENFLKAWICWTDSDAERFRVEIFDYQEYGARGT